MLSLPMEVKAILEKIRQPKNAEKKECFWALQIGFSLVKSAIWTAEAGLVEILADGEERSFQTDQELLEAIDETLSSAVAKLENQTALAEPNKVVLGVPRDWVANGQIIASQAKLLKEISKELSLSLAGFVVLPEAVIFRIKSLEGVPPSAILVYLEKEKIGVDLVNLGKTLGSEVVVRSDDLAADLIEGLSRIKYEGIFPARILLYGAKEALAPAKQQLEAFAWQQPSFLHLPKTEPLEANFDVWSVALAGGREIAQTKGIKGKVPVATKTDQPEVTDQAMAMGFVKEADVAQQAPPPTKTSPPKQRRFKLPHLAFPKKSFLPVIIIFIFLVLAGGGVAAYWYLPKAEVAIFLRPQILEKEFSVHLDPDLTVADKKKLILPAEKLELRQKAEKTMATTGTKLIGERAKGKVTIFNDTTQEKKFAAGTKIISTSGLVFTLDEAASVASKSGTAADSTPGQAEVAVTAAEIGAEANLAAGIEFAVADYSRSDYLAKNNQAFSGGTSREVQVVAKADLEKLLGDLQKDLNADVLAKLADKLEAGQKIVEQTLRGEFVQKEFDHQVGEEAETVSLKAEMKFTVLVFSEADFKDLIMDEVRALVPDGFEYRPEKDQISFALDQVTKNGEALFTVTFATKLAPVYDPQAIRENLAGKKVAVGEIYLRNLVHVENVEARVLPRFLAWLNTFPRRTDNIKIDLVIK